MVWNSLAQLQFKNTHEKPLWKFKKIYSRGLNDVQDERVSYQKHLGILLDEKLNFKHHNDSAISKVKKSITVIKNLRHNLPRNTFISHNIQSFSEAIN